MRAGGVVSGSDRDFDRGGSAALREALTDLGIVIHPQDGSGVTADLGAVVASTAVESEVPDVVAARAAGVAIIHRSELLAAFVRSHRTIAITGTSGKSTAVAMVFEILRASGRDPSVITGGEIQSLREDGWRGNAWAGRGDLLVIEADESDGSLVRYEPAIAVILNLQRDHREMEEVLAMFRSFAQSAREALVAGEDARFEGLGTDEGGSARGGAGARAINRLTFGFGPAAGVRPERVELLAQESRFEVDGVPVRLPLPGRHNVENAIAAIATARAAGVATAEAAAALASFSGVARRFESVGVARGVEVVDDFAHNPAKITAALATAALRLEGAAPGSGPAGRVLAVYQPHGYGPTRFLRADYVDAFSRALRPADHLWLLEIFYAGGTAVRDLSAADIAAEIAGRGAPATFAPSRDALVAAIAAEARAGDLVLVMGARDPSLPDLARRILAALAA